MATPDDPPGTESQPVWRPGEWMQSPFAAETPERRPAPIAPEVALAPAARLAARADLAGCLLAVGGLIVSWLASRDSASAGPTLLTLVVALVALAALSVAVGVWRAPTHANIQEIPRFPLLGLGLLVLDGLARSGFTAALSRLDAGYWIALAGLALALLTSLFVWWRADVPMNEDELKRSGLVRGDHDHRRPLNTKRSDFTIRSRRS